LGTGTDLSTKTQINNTLKQEVKMFGKKNLILENNKLLLELSSLQPKVLAIDVLFKEKRQLPKKSMRLKSNTLKMKSVKQ